VIRGRVRTRRLVIDSETQAKSDIKLLERSGEEEFYLEEDDYSFPFQFTLDEDLASSFEHAHARIRYFLRAIIHTLCPSSNVFARISFSVSNRLDLNNLDAVMKIPYSLEHVKTLGCFPFFSYPVSINFLINKCAFVPGERIRFQVEINNSSKRQLKNIRVYLNQQIDVFTESKSNVYKKKLGYVPLPKGVIAALSVEKWNSSYRIPAICPTLTDCSRILKISYFLNLFMQASGSLFSENELSIPITIGTIPLIQDDEAAPGFSNSSPEVRDDLSVRSLPTYNMAYFEDYFRGGQEDPPPPYIFDGDDEDDVKANEVTQSYETDKMM
jgi:hypothetical protein